MESYTHILTAQEQEILTCSKDNWHKTEKRYSEFLAVLNKYIQSYKQCSLLDLSFSFPEITFDHELLKRSSITIRDAI